ncbi:MAG TPA: hypothetical protein VNO50_16715 [Pyrinomonadaceae bacterium]|nr:hypothetical protein [Pyrinomonadaceae bacterium]
MKTRLTVILFTVTGLVILAGQVSGGSSAAPGDKYVNPDYKGGSSFNLASAGPNVPRCGAFPDNIELNFQGSGIDTEGGYNTAVFSACTNTTTNLVFDLKATDTYVQSGDQVFIEGDPFVLAPNPANCSASNAQGVPFRVTGGTGGRAGAKGHGKFHITSNLTPCNGLVVPAQVWFKGVFKLPN